MSATISNCTRPLGEATQDGIYLHAVILFHCVWILYVLYDWRVFQKLLSSITAEIQKTQALLAANAVVLASNAAEIQKTQAALDANEAEMRRMHQGVKLLKHQNRALQDCLNLNHKITKT
jgi:hypothetical protein